MITVLMATRNRAGILEQVLDSYTRLRSPAGGWETIVVDNGSVDSTPDIVQRFAGRLPVTYVAEPQAGKSRAVNAGLRHAKGNLTLFTDDDILPTPDWLVHYASAAASQPDFDLFGGPVLLKWPCEPPAWAICNVAIKVACFSKLDPSLRTGPYAGPMFGGNFAVRALVIAKQGGFDPLIGPAPGSYRIGNETEFITRLRGSGHRAWWIEDAVVEHVVRKEQVDRKWMLQRAIKFGRGEYAREVRCDGSPKLIAGLPRWLIRKVGTQAARAAAARIFGNEQDAFVKRWHLNRYWGMIAEARRIQRDAAGSAGA